MEKKLIAVDLDGTVLPSVTEFPVRTRKALATAVESGHTVMVTSARPWEMTKWVYEAIGIEGPVCLFNGALVTNPFDRSFPTLELNLTPDSVKGILNKVFEAISPPRAYIEYKEYCWTLNDTHNSYYKDRLMRSIAAYFTPDRIPDTPASKLQIYAFNEDDARKIVTIAEAFDGICAIPVKNPKKVGGWRCSVMDKNANKWNAVIYTAKTLGIDTNNIYTFGDQWNDFEMVSKAAHGYGMLGSPAAEVSRFVTQYSCADFGVADIIEREILQT